VLETLGTAYYHDKLARASELSPEKRLPFHQECSEPLMKQLRTWLDTQMARNPAWTPWNYHATLGRSCANADPR
jgi:hypothetical protein